MALYIAICDDHVADRKQLERLLGREKDERLKTGLVLYIDFFGSSDALLNAQIRYDLLLIDVTGGLTEPTEETVNGMDIAKRLRLLGLSSPIALCSSTIDYTAYGNPAVDITILSKPISQGQLSHLIDIALEKQKNKEPLIEIRGKKDTYNIPQRDIIFAHEKDNLTEVCLTGSKEITMLGKMKLLIQQLPDPGAFGYCADDYMVNFAHVEEMKKNAFVMDTKDVIRFHFLQRHELKNALIKYRLREK